MKIIDVLNKIADETLEDEFEFKLKYDGTIWHYVKGFNTIEDDDSYDFFENYELGNCLNDEIEVIEKFKKIEKLEMTKAYIKDDYNSLAENIIDCQLKLNEVIDKLNELLEKAEK